MNPAHLSRIEFSRNYRRGMPGSRLLPMLAALLVLGAAAQTSAQVTVKVDSTQAWTGYLNWFNTNNVYAGGGAWATADLRGTFEPSQSNATAVVLGVNTNTYDPADPFWNLPDGTSVKLLEANFYVDVGTDFAGEAVTFEGFVEANTLPVGWTSEAVIKEFASGYSYIGDTRVALVAGQPFSVTRPIGAARICQYGFLTYGPNAAPDSAAAMTSVRVLVDNADPSITGAPADLRRQLGETAVFTVVAVGESAISYQWSVIQGGVTNLLSDGGNVSGSSTDMLTLSNLQLSDIGTYAVTVTDLAGSKRASANLDVKTPEEYVNFLSNPRFEDDPTGEDDSPWQRFESADPAAGTLQSTNNTYFGGGNVNVYEGDWVSFTVFNGAYSGIYQDAPAEPGQIFTADAWFYNASGDPIPGGVDSGTTNECYLEVQFRAGETVIQQYLTDIFDYTAPRDVWFNLQATNAGTYGSTPPASDAIYLIAPPETTKVRFQITMHDIANSVNLGSLYYDDASLLLKVPVLLDVAQSAGNAELTWQSQASTSYLVQYKDHIEDAVWSDLEVVAGNGGPITVPYPATTDQRIYRVLTL